MKITEKYGGQDYWEKRYQNEKDMTYDWLENMDDLKDII